MWDRKRGKNGWFLTRLHNLLAAASARRAVYVRVCEQQHVHAKPEPSHKHVEETGRQKQETQ